MKIRSMVAITLALGIVTAQSSASAATLTNKIIGVGPAANPINPYVCIQDETGTMTYALAPGESVDANKYSKNIYYVGATLRFGGCSSSNSYLGYIGINLPASGGSKSTPSYSAPDGIPIKFSDDRSVDSSGNLTGRIEYSEIKTNDRMLDQAPKQNASWDFIGVNLAGLEFGKVVDPFVIPNLSQEDAGKPTSDLADTKAFMQAGMNTVRVPLSWGFLQLDGAGKGEINKNYFNSYVKPLLATLTKAKVNVIVDLHSYMRYSQFGKEYSGCGGEGACPDGTLVTDANVYQDIWTKLYQAIKNDSSIDQNYIMLDLVNEPVDVPNDLVFTIQAQVIKALRQQGFQGYILVEGNSWTGMHSWNTYRWTSTDGKKTYTNGTLFTRDNFAAAGITDLSKIVINVHQYLDYNFSGTQQQCLTDLSTFNTDSFMQYLKENKLKAMVTEFGAGQDVGSCSGTLNAFMQFMQANSAKNKDYGFLGWTIWSTGHGWGGYNLRVTPASYQMQILKNYL